MNDEILKNKELEEENKALKDKLNKITQNQINEMNKIKGVLEKLKNENIKLNEQLLKANILITNLSNNKVDIDEFTKLKDEYSSLKCQINVKDKEIKDLQQKIAKNKKEDEIDSLEDILVINFISKDSTVNYNIKCCQNDLFAEIEEKLYKKYNDYRETNNMFTVNSNPVLRFKTLCENNIHNGDIIQLSKLE